MNIDAMFKNAEAQATAFLALLKQKTPPTDSRTNRFRELELQAMDLASKARNGHHFQTAVTLLFLEGMALGLDAMTDQEIADINKAR